MSNWITRSRQLFKNNQGWMATQEIKNGLSRVPDWRITAKKHLREDKILKALTICKKHSIETQHFRDRYSVYSRTLSRVQNQKRTYSQSEINQQNKICAALVWDITQAISDTNKPMPEYLK